MLEIQISNSYVFLAPPCSYSFFKLADLFNSSPGQEVYEMIKSIKFIIIPNGMFTMF